VAYQSTRRTRVSNQAPISEEADQRRLLVRAILSDIHGNLEALMAVLAELEKAGVATLYNLGDTLGYGPDPVECLDLTRRMTLALKVNFDQAVLSTPDGFSPIAGRSVLWTQIQLGVEPDATVRRERASFLANLQSSHREGEFLFVHGSARDPLYEYVFPEDVHNEQKMARIGERSGQLCFCGHTHIPGVFVERRPGRWEFIQPEECKRGFPVAGQRIICNVGSVGQPRDGDERACYVSFDGERVWFHRVRYDVETTIRKIRAVPELDDFLGDRLRKGR
jgi:diadenosine tetraphosphatase ApaH/serine/threonine PP2A family protein phosphatase